MTDLTLHDVLENARRCRVCADQLPHAPRPVIQAAPRATLLIVGQAPGARVHASGLPWDDPSGDRLRGWLNLPARIFYDENRVAIMPMGFCYPGSYRGRGRSGDLPPRPECAPRWHAALLARMPDIRLTLLIGHYAQRHYLHPRHRTLTETVKAWRDHLPGFFALPHPSPRNQSWLKHNPWFEDRVLPELKRRVRDCLSA